MNRTGGNSNAGASTSKGASSSSNSNRSFDKGAFAKDISSMMYAFGDVPNPSGATVGVMEEMVVDFMVDLCMRARPSPLAVPQASPAYPPTARLKAKVEDFKHALRREPKYLARLQELLYMEFVIQEARKTFDETEYGRDEVLAPREGATPAPQPSPEAPTDPAPPVREKGKRARPSAPDGEPKKRQKKKANTEEGGGSRKGKAKAEAGSPPPPSQAQPGPAASPPPGGLALPGLALPGTPATSAHPSPVQHTIALPGTSGSH